MSQPTNIGLQLREIVEQQGRSPRWIARQLSCHRTTIYKMLRGEPVNVEYVNRTAKLLNLKIELKSDQT